MTEYDTVLDYLKAHYGIRNVVPIDANRALVRIKGKTVDVDLSTFTPFSTTKADTIMETYG